jgi:membrane protein implicated in regulation of membrane protease activity
MTWETFYGACFATGVLFSVFSFFGGALHAHVPKGFHFHWGGGHAAPGAHARGASYFNFGTIAAFLAWFGGTGYLLSRYSSLWTLLALGLSIISGLAGAAIVFWFLFKVLLAHEKDLNPADYEMIGVFGRVSSAIREGGIGEIIFSQEGVRRAVSVRSESGRPIASGAEVVVTQYKDGIAYVRPWEEFSRISAPGGERQEIL